MNFTGAVNVVNYVGEQLSCYKGLKIVGYNIRSLRANIEEVRVNFYDADILCLCESWLNDGCDQGTTCMANKTEYRLDRPTDRAGGLIIYVENSIGPYTKTLEEHSLMTDNIEFMVLSVEKPT